MKKITSLMLAILLIAMSLAACDNADDPEETTAEDTSIHSIVTEVESQPDSTDEPSESTSPEGTKAPETTATVTEQVTEPQTEPQTTPATEPQTTPATEPQTEPVTEPATEPETTAPAAPETEPPHVHSYGEWEVTVAATCVDFGERVRRCSCGEVLREDILPEGHYYVDGICTVCGAGDGELETPTLRLLDNLEFDSILYSTPNMIVFCKDELYYVANKAGEVISRGYTGAKCASLDEYVVMYDTLLVGVTDIEDDDYVGLKETTKLITCYVLDYNGNELFSTRYTYTQRDLGSTTYEGEFIATCNEERIITYTPETYHFPSAYSPMTVNIYDMHGTKLATFDDIVSVGTLINGELLMLYQNSGNFEAMVTNNNGKVLRTGTIGPINFFPANYWTTNGFIGGYALFTDDTAFVNSYLTTLVSYDLETTLSIRSDYLYSPTNFGSYVASNIVENGVVSDKYYLIDLTRCALDSNGYCIPTIDAAVSPEGFDKIMIESFLNKNYSYALVSRDGKWGYMSFIDGSVRMFDDAGYFFLNYAVVMEGNTAYVINTDLEQVSEPIEGVTRVATSGCGVYDITVNGKRYIAIYD